MTVDNPEQNELLTQLIALPPDLLGLKLLSPAKAALVLDLSVSTLEKRRKAHLPPPPAPNFAGGKRGSDVKYLALTLVEFIKGLPITQPNPYREYEEEPIAWNAAMYRKLSLSSMGPLMSLAKSTVETQVEEVEAEWPFFVDEQLRISAPCWEDKQQTLDLFLNDAIEVEWKSWPQALAGVWLDESQRLEWLRHADRCSPGIRQKAEEIRRNQLSGM